MASPRWFALAVLVLLPACGDPPIEPVEPLARVDLRAATGRADVKAIGVTVDGAGNRLVLDEEAGLYRIDGAGTATLVLALADFPDPGVIVRPPFTDLAAVGDRLALTAIGDGYLLDLAAGTMTRHFCYEPGGFPEDQEQRTNALAFDASTGRLYAQPRTFDQDRSVVRSEIGMYAADSGLDLDWWTLPTELDAGGMLAPGGNTLVLGAGPRLLTYDLTGSRLTASDDLTRFGVGAIDGLARDATTGTTLVLDGAHDQLVELDPSF